MLLKDSENWSARYTGELIGTYFLVLTVGCNVLHDSIGTGLAVGAMLASMVYAIGPVSGAHLNPAVTLAVVLAELLKGRRKSLDNSELVSILVYVPFQLFGGLLAGLTFAILCNNAFHLEPVGRYHWKTAAMMEVIYTAALCYVVLSVTCSSVKKTGNQCSGLAIGFTVTAAAFTIGGISGCALNPAVAMGTIFAKVNFISWEGAFRYAPLYFCCPIVGSILGVGLFALVFPNELADDVKPVVRSGYEPSSTSLA